MPDQDARRLRGRPPKSDPPKSGLLLQAALAAFAEEGYSGASLRKIAAAAGTDAALVTHNFGSKAGLWKAVIDDLTGHLTVAITSAVDESETLPASEQLRQAAAGVMDALCDTPHLAQFLVKEITNKGEKVEYVYERLARPIRDLIVPLIEAARNESEAPVEDADFAFINFFAALSATVAAREFLDRLRFSPVSNSEFREKLQSINFIQSPRPRP